jgi:anti-sigma-K factor RskA
MSDPVRPIDLSCDDVREMAGSFVLGALPEDEAAAVRAHLASCEDAHAEIAELGGLLPVLDASVESVEPPAALKGRILAAAAAERPATATSPARNTSPAEVASDGSSVVPFPAPDERAERAPVKTTTSPLAWVLRIAAVLAIVALTGWNVLLQGQLGTSQQFERDVAAVLDAAQQPGSLAAILSPDDGTGSGIAAVTATGELTLAMRDLAPTSGTQVYETWVIPADGVPVALGGFQVGRDGTATFAGTGLPVADGIVLALTLEPVSGMTAPTGPVVSKGVASAAG